MKALTTVENTIEENMNYAQAAMNKCVNHASASGLNSMPIRILHLQQEWAVYEACKRAAMAIMSIIESWDPSSIKSASISSFILQYQYHGICEYNSIVQNAIALGSLVSTNSMKPQEIELESTTHWSRKTSNSVIKND